MDGSFLSDERVVSASRDFVCIRLATYEDQQEADFMKGVFTSRSGVLENTTFGILSSDGNENLVRSGRGPMHAFRNSTSMANRMTLIALQHSGAKQARWTDKILPVMKSVDVALNVAACDNLPVLVTFAESKERLEEINAAVMKTTWMEQGAGQFVCASTTNRAELKPIPGVELTEGVLVVEPGPFGLSGKIMLESKLDESQGDLSRKLLQAAASFKRVPPEYSSHIALGVQLGIDWESEIPETDQQSLRAKQRVRGTQ